MNNMHRFVCLLSILAYGSFTAIAQQATAPKAGKKQNKITAQEQAIQSIRASYQRINAMPLQNELFRYEAEACVEDGVVTYFRKDGAIVKITESGSIGDGSWVNEYYFQKGKPIFCYEVSIGGPAIGAVTRIERISYIAQDTLFRYMVDQQITSPDAKAKAIIQTAYQLLAAYETKAFAAALCE